MRPLFKTRFRLLPEGDRTPGQVADEAFAALREWVEEHELEDGHPVAVRVREIVWDRDRPYQIRESSLPDGSFHRALLWTHPDSGGEFWWTVAADLVCLDGVLELQFVLGVEAEDLADVPEDLCARQPRIVRRLLASDHWSCQAESVRLPLMPRRYTVHEVDEIVSEVLFDPQRTLPVLFFGEKREGKASPISPGRLATRLAGLVKVHYPRDGVAAEALNERLGPDLAVTRGMVRVFMPGLTPSDDPAHHWAFLFDTIERRGMSGDEFGDWLFARLAERSLVTVGESPLLGVHRRRARDHEERRWRELEHRLADEERAAEELLLEYEQRVATLTAERDRLQEQLRSREDENQSLRRQLRIAQRNIEELSREVGRGPLDLGRSTGGAAQPRTVGDIVAALADELEHLEFLQSAFRSAEEVPETFRRPEEVERLLRALDEAARVRNAHGGRIPGGWKEYFTSAGVPGYRPTISDATAQRWGEEYTFRYGDEDHLFEEHFTIGAGNPNTCLSIHFSTRLRDDRIVVAWVGRHLRNTQT